jgi:hypothetical protein
MRAVRNALCVTTITGIALLIQAAGAAHDLADPLDVTSVALVSSDTDGDFVSETYRATLHHSGPPGTRDFARVSAKLTGAVGLSVPGFIQVVDSEVAFGTIRASETIDSLDTFAIKRHRRVPLNPRQLRWAVSSRPDLVLPDEWTGTWRFELTATDPTTKRIESTSSITEALGRREPIGFSLLPDFIRCHWQGTADALSATCDGSARLGWCLTSGSAVFSLNRDGDVATGDGTVHVTQTGNCGNGDDEASDAIAIAGTRLTPDADEEPLSVGLLPLFSTNPYFGALLSHQLRELDQRPPSADDDCRHGGWHRFRSRALRSESACIAFLHSPSHENGGAR